MTLTSSNSYSHGRLEMELGEYVERLMVPTPFRANETLYLFGSHQGNSRDLGLGLGLGLGLRSLRLPPK